MNQECQYAGRRSGLMMAFCLALGVNLMASGPCDPPPFDPLVPLRTAEQALEMDAWARKALRRDVKGKTCPEQQEVVNVLLVRWLQAHPEIHIAFQGVDAAGWLDRPDEFLLRLKTSAWTELQGRRSWFPRSWGGPVEDLSLKSAERKEAYAAKTLDRLRTRSKK